MINVLGCHVCELTDTEVHAAVSDLQLTPLLKIDTHCMLVRFMYKVSSTCPDVIQIRTIIIYQDRGRCRFQSQVPQLLFADCKNPGHDGKCLSGMAQIWTKHEDLYEKIQMFIMISGIQKTK